MIYALTDVLGWGNGYYGFLDYARNDIGVSYFFCHLERSGVTRSEVERSVSMGIADFSTRLRLGRNDTNLMTLRPFLYNKRAAEAALLFCIMKIRKRPAPP